MMEKKDGYFTLGGSFKDKGLKLGFSPKSCGNMSLSWGERKQVIKNRITFIKGMEIRGCFVTFLLTHGSRVAVIKDSNLARKINDPQAVLSRYDGAITNIKGLYFLMCSADCLPIIYHDRKLEVVGIAHAGWRGLMKGIEIQVLRLMAGEYGSSMNNIVVGLGPSIGSCCNLQETPLAQENLPQWRPYIKRVDKLRSRVMLNEYCIDSLTSFGILSQNIEQSRCCTVDYCHQFFSETAVRIGKDLGPMGRFCTVYGLI